MVFFFSNRTKSKAMILNVRTFPPALWIQPVEQKRRPIRIRNADPDPDPSEFSNTDTDAT
jgi:hypothetical protein